MFELESCKNRRTGTSPETGEPRQVKVKGHSEKKVELLELQQAY
jgi:hypothetical protein